MPLSNTKFQNNKNISTKKFGKKISVTFKEKYKRLRCERKAKNFLSTF